ncbi:SlyX family protein [Phaeospirillum tilakii]|uniref:Protein SlyX homolog n=1 Tax=Phaeospirillum tilakii TaxID=741673 RepID=A0ABW5C8V9_9PROT
MTEQDEERLIALESRLAHHERMAEEISDVLAAQGRTIDRLTAEIRRLRERLRELEVTPTRAPQDEPPPPHY